MKNGGTAGGRGGREREREEEHGDSRISISLPVLVGTIEDFMCTCTTWALCATLSAICFASMVHGENEFCSIERSDDGYSSSQLVSLCYTEVLAFENIVDPSNLRRTWRRFSVAVLK